MKRYILTLLFFCASGTLHAQTIIDMCTGIARSCSSLSSVSCDFQLGCTYNSSTNSCNGIAWQCRDLSQTNCYLQDGCSLISFLYPDPLTEVIISYYDDEEGRLEQDVTLYLENAPDAPLYSFNTADSNWDWISWMKDQSSKVRVEYSQNNNSWIYLTTFDEASYRVELCMTNDNSAFIPDHCQSFPRLSSGNLYYRFRTEINGVERDWQYMRPIHLYRDS